MIHHRLWCAWLLMGLLLGGCLSPLSREARFAAEPYVDFSRLLANPEADLGKTFLLGGVIVNTEVGAEGSTLEVLRYELDRGDRPQQPDEASGRFLVRAARVLDPVLYAKGRLVTLTGQLIGVESRALGSLDYRYPVLALGELYLWPQELDYHRPPGSYYPYGPLYWYDPWYDPYPFWPRPHDRRW
jgi:outer membrane lipoprotein